MINVYPNTDAFMRCLSCYTVHEFLFDIEIRYEDSHCGHILTLCNDCLQKITEQHQALRDVLKIKNTSENKGNQEKLREIFP